MGWIFRQLFRVVISTIAVRVIRQFMGGRRQTPELPPGRRS
ncbi:MAG TPA: hypothetical protein VNE62_00515 [Actinomycetota bacterium]|nr:hypothetical protein [Actinomycetota bacterium]